jgi:AraC-like DNA-binding protein
MLFLAHKPTPTLAPFVDHLWCVHDAPTHQREHVMPAGTLELVINLAEDELRIYDRDDPRRCTRFAGAMVSGAYSRYFVIDTREHASIIGAHFKPGGAVHFFGMPPGHLGNMHVELSQLWGPSARDLRNQLCDARSVQQQFELLEEALLRRLSDQVELRPAARAGLEWLRHGRRVAEVAKELALSRRRFTSVFKEDVGLTPKVFARVHRFQHAVAVAQAQTLPDWSQLAAETGYFDQSHMIRDFVEFSGFGPAALHRQQRQTKDNHVAV